MKIHFTSSELANARERYEVLVGQYGQHDEAGCDVVVALGGDGLMLTALKATFESGKPVFGMNCGTVGFLMNEYRADGLVERIEAAESTIIHPLVMEAEEVSGGTATAHGINEVSLLRETQQTARIRILVDGVERLGELYCDGALLATAAGSTAYNFSAHGPIIPLGSEVLALTPISAFRPRRWRGALVRSSSEVTFEVLDPDRRPVGAAADAVRVASVSRVTARRDDSISLTLLSDPGHDLEEKAMREQFAL